MSTGLYIHTPPAASNTSSHMHVPLVAPLSGTTCPSLNTVTRPSETHQRSTTQPPRQWPCGSYIICPDKIRTAAGKLTWRKIAAPPAFQRHAGFTRQWHRLLHYAAGPASVALSTPIELTRFQAFLWKRIAHDYVVNSTNMKSRPDEARAAFSRAYSPCLSCMVWTSRLKRRRRR